MKSDIYQEVDAALGSKERDESWEEIKRVEAIATWMDDRYLDPILGFVFPGAGDIFSMLLGLYAVHVAQKHKLPPVIIARMLLNLGVDALIGAIPMLGDIFDFFSRAHSRNLRLLRERNFERKAKASDWLLVGAAATGVALVTAAPVVVAVKVLGWLFG